MNGPDALAVRLLNYLRPPRGAADPPLIAEARQAGSGASLESLFDAVAERRPGASRTAQRRRALAGLLVGAVAEREFQRRYTAAMQGQQFSFDDQRAGATETDFLILNGAGRPAFRINIKAHGTLFQKAEEFVGLEPEDCFAKIAFREI